VFIISAIFYFIGGTQAIFFTSGELQKWAKHSPTQRKSLRRSSQVALDLKSSDLNKTVTKPNERINPDLCVDNVFKNDQLYRNNNNKINENK
jgi:hypothetical protein